MNTPNRKSAFVNRGYLDYVIDKAVEDLIVSISLISMGHALSSILNKIEPNDSIRSICSIAMIISFIGPAYIIKSRYRKSIREFEKEEEEENKVE